MSWQSDILTAIAADATLFGIVGNNVFSDAAPGNASAPFVVYQQISEIGETPFDGVRSVTFPLVQFSCWATTKPGAITLATALTGAIEGKNLPGSNNVSLGFINHTATRDQQTKYYGEQIDYRVSTNPN